MTSLEGGRGGEGRGEGTKGGERSDGMRMDKEVGKGEERVGVESILWKGPLRMEGYGRIGRGRRVKGQDIEEREGREGLGKKSKERKRMKENCKERETNRKQKGMERKC